MKINGVTNAMARRARLYGLLEGSPDILGTIPILDMYVRRAKLHDTTRQRVLSIASQAKNENDALNAIRAYLMYKNLARAQNIVHGR